MLIVAMPKSASTALHETLVESTDLEMADYPEVELKNKPVHKDWSAIALMHGDCRKLPSSLLKKWATSNQVYKQHVLPSNQHQQALKDHKIIILLRNPKDAVLSYFRTHKNLGATYPIFSKCETEKDWLDQAQQNGLLNDMENFYKQCSQYKGKHLLINYKQLTTNPQKVLKQVCQFWDVSLSDNHLELKKSRYTRIPAWKKSAIQARRRLGKIFSKT